MKHTYKGRRTSNKQLSRRTYPLSLFILYNTLHINPLVWYTLAFINQNVSLNHANSEYFGGLVRELQVYVWLESVLPDYLQFRRSSTNDNRFNDIDYWLYSTSFSVKTSNAKKIHSFIFDITHVNAPDYLTRAGIHTCEADYYLVLHNKTLYLIDRLGVLDEVKYGGWNSITPGLDPDRKVGFIAKSRLLNKRIAICLGRIDDEPRSTEFVRQLFIYCSTNERLPARAM